MKNYWLEKIDKKEKINNLSIGIKEEDLVVVIQKPSADEKEWELDV